VVCENGKKVCSVGAEFSILSAGEIYDGHSVWAVFCCGYGSDGGICYGCDSEGDYDYGCGSEVGFCCGEEKAAHVSWVKIVVGALEIDS
jgi:hypothetical protein